MACELLELHLCSKRGFSFFIALWAVVEHEVCQMVIGIVVVVVIIIIIITIIIIIIELGSLPAT
jgi:hypothetical protein